MVTLLNFIGSIADLIVGLVGYLIHVISDVIYMIGLLASIVLYFPSYITWVPPTIAGSITVIISLAVVYKIIGREG